jgi:hypothetical protein
VLVDEYGHFKAFGYEAEHDYYLGMLEGRKYELYKNFKMTLYKNKDLSLHSIILSANNKPHKAIDIFAMALRFLMDHFLDNLKQSKIDNIDLIRDMIK